MGWVCLLFVHKMCTCRISLRGLFWGYRAQDTRYWLLTHDVCWRICMLRSREYDAEWGTFTYVTLIVLRWATLESSSSFLAMYVERVISHHNCWEWWAYNLEVCITYRTNSPQLLNLEWAIISPLSLYYLHIKSTSSRLLTERGRRSKIFIFITYVRYIHCGIIFIF